jgi:hypothetical protein
MKKKKTLSFEREEIFEQVRGGASPTKNRSAGSYSG